jgi:hypothetical protein
MNDMTTVTTLELCESIVECEIRLADLKLEVERRTGMPYEGFVDQMRRMLTIEPASPQEDEAFVDLERINDARRREEHIRELVPDGTYGGAR